MFSYNTFAPFVLMSCYFGLCDTAFCFCFVGSESCLSFIFAFKIFVLYFIFDLMLGVLNKSLTRMFDTHRSLSFKAARFVRPSRASKFSIPSRSVFSKETSGRTTSYICNGKSRNMEN